MSIITNVKDAGSWIGGAAYEPFYRLLRLDVKGTVGSILRIPYKVVSGGKALFGKGSIAAERGAQEALRKQFPNGSPGAW